MPPLISLLLPIKNGLPHLRATIEAVRRQTYREYELIVQDGGSTDGTLDYLSSLREIPGLSIASEADRGVGQAYNRALTRSSGDLVCFISADEYLENDSLARGFAWFKQHPDAVIVNGAVRLIDANDEVIQIFEAPAFDLPRHLRCEAVLPFAGLINRRRAGQDLFYDESLRTCPDYDFWIRLGSRVDPADFISKTEVFKTARADRISMSFRSESYDQFCRDKLFVLDRYLASRPAGAEVDDIRRSATAGIYLWAAESLLYVEGPSPAFLKWCEAAAGVEPLAPRLLTLARRSRAFAIDDLTGRFSVPTSKQPAEPPTDAVVVPGGVALDEIRTHTHWAGATITHGSVTRVHTPKGPWEYAAEVPLAFDGMFDDRSWYWVCLDLEVRVGQVGVALLITTDIACEQIVSQLHGRRTVFVAVSSDEACAIVIRNGGMRQSSTVDIFGVSIRTCPQTVVELDHAEPRRELQ